MTQTLTPAARALLVALVQNADAAGVLAEQAAALLPGADAAGAADALVAWADAESLALFAEGHH